MAEFTERYKILDFFGNKVQSASGRICIDKFDADKTVVKAYCKAGLLKVTFGSVFNLHVCEEFYDGFPELNAPKAEKKPKVDKHFIFPFLEVTPSYWIKRVEERSMEHNKLRHFLFTSQDNSVDVIFDKDSDYSYEWLE